MRAASALPTLTATYGLQGPHGWPDNAAYSSSGARQCAHPGRRGLAGPPGAWSGDMHQVTPMTGIPIMHRQGPVMMHLGCVREVSPFIPRTAVLRG